MNRMIINIGHMKYIFNPKYTILLINSITQFHELCDYKFWTYKKYFKFNKFNHAVPSMYIYVRVHVFNSVYVQNY